MNDSIQKLRYTAKSLFDVAVAAADPAAALQNCLADQPLNATGKLIILAIGKAAIPMMRVALDNVAPNSNLVALAVTNPENAAELPGVEIHLTAHPVPDEKGAAAGARVIEILRDTTPDDRVIALISGGGSALLPCPVEGVSLEDKAAVSQALLGAGLDIVQMNLVRQQLSQLKGGGLLRHAAPAPVTSYILSDVVGDDLRAIASGPTVAPIGTRADAVNVLQSAGIFEGLPESVKAHLLSVEVDEGPVPAADNHLICSNRKSLEAIRDAANVDFQAEIIDDQLEGNVKDVAPRLLKIAQDAGPGPRALIFGGETTVTLTGSGKGGRNQDLALRFSSLAGDLEGPWVFLSGGTDGRDGPTDAAGGIVDPHTISRIAAAGLDADALLADNDSYRALGAAGDLLMTGGTGTNVADVQVFLKL